LIDDLKRLVAEQGDGLEEAQSILNDGMMIWPTILSQRLSG
jgi:hypothetical protein